MQKDNSFNYNNNKNNKFFTRSIGKQNKAMICLNLWWFRNSWI